LVFEDSRLGGKVYVSEVLLIRSLLGAGVVAYQVAVLLRGDPDVAVAPLAQLAELLHLGVVVLLVVFDGEAGRVVHAHVAAEAEEDAAGFVSEESGV
jgi:hypothetical protein